MGEVQRPNQENKEADRFGDKDAQESSSKAGEEEQEKAHGRQERKEMSIKIMSKVFEESETRQGARLVLLALSDSASDEGFCWPSVRAIAKKAGLSMQVTREYLHAFEKTGLLIIVARTSADDTERQTSNSYQINVEKIGHDVLPRDVLLSVKPASRKHPFLTGVTGGDSNRGETHPL